MTIDYRRENIDRTKFSTECFRQLHKNCKGYYILKSGVNCQCSCHKGTSRTTVEVK